tara:strand:- start:195 stop:2573 length:2379 start_codon:yes stop_codon:yes gene_type:complete
MDKSSKKDQEKKKVPPTKTYTVPFDLEEIKENITSNTLSQSSKEHIINQAFKYHSEGNLVEAAKYYQHFINEGYSDFRVFSNYGVTLKDLGKSQKAELYVRKAINLNPDYSEAHYNLGIILKDLGKLEEAELSAHKAIDINPNFSEAHYSLGIILKDLGKLQKAELYIRKAIDLNPNYANAHLNLGNILTEMGKLQEAEIYTRKAIGLNPYFAEAYSNLGIIMRDIGNLKDAELYTSKAIELNPYFVIAHWNLGNILSDIGKSEEAFNSYLKVIEINPETSNIYNSIISFIFYSDQSQLNKTKLKKILNILLEKNDLRHQELFEAFNFLYRNELISNLEILDANVYDLKKLVNNKIIINSLKKIIFEDTKLEELLTKVRRNMCRQIAKKIEMINQSDLEFIIALGEQCFLNEYVYSLTEKEEKYINKILYNCTHGELNETNISILSCYFPLYKLLSQIPSLQSFNSCNQSFQGLIQLQILEPIKEIELSKDIKKLGKINDKISKKVKSQYEENPYPRWRYINPASEQNISAAQAINHEITPNSINYNLKEKQLKVLIAGCGTGNQIVQAQRYKNADITAIDLSLSSLSYAHRKINELGIQNVELVNMDILEVKLLEEKFDIIECVGVLHHMDHPSKGLKELLGILKNNGFLKLAVYSEIARQDIVQARKYIAKQQLDPSEKNIRNFRQKVISDELKDLKSLKNIVDFYSLSHCRDLCFHAKEHRFTINQLQETIESHQLNFLGFQLPQPVKSLYKSYFPEDKAQTNLQNWARFEEKYPNNFIKMYRFWVCKT